MIPRLILKGSVFFCAKKVLGHFFGDFYDKIKTLLIFTNKARELL